MQKEGLMRDLIRSRNFLIATVFVVLLGALATAQVALKPGSGGATSAQAPRYEVDRDSPKSTMVLENDKTSLVLMPS